MSEIELNNKINNYLNKRIVYLIALTELDLSVYDDIITSQQDNMKDILESIYEFQEKNKDGLLEENEKNILAFINRPQIRFNGTCVNKDNNDIINKIIENVNTSEFKNGNFLLSEFQKFFTFKNKLIIKDCYLDNFYYLEQYVHIFLSDMLFLSDDDFFAEYLEKNEALWNEDILYVLNYLLDDFPVIYENKLFAKRAHDILYCNKVMYKSFIIQELESDEKINAVKLLKYARSFRIKNNDLIKNVDRKI